MNGYFRCVHHNIYWLQATGFLACFVLFLLPAVLWGPLTGSQNGRKAFQFIYFFSSFWNQFGPNCTTFLVAGESTPYVLYLLRHHCLALMAGNDFASITCVCLHAVPPCMTECSTPCASCAKLQMWHGAFFLDHVCHKAQVTAEIVMDPVDRLVKGA